MVPETGKPGKGREHRRAGARATGPIAEPPFDASVTPLAETPAETPAEGQPPGAPAEEADPQPTLEPGQLEQKRENRVLRFLYCHWPPSGSFLFLLLVIVMALILDIGVNQDAVKSPACDCDAATVGHREWQIWVVAVSAGLSIAALLAIRGVTNLQRLNDLLPDPPKDSAAHSTASGNFRPAPSAVLEHGHHAGVTEPMIRRYGWLALLWVLCLGIAVFFLVHDPRQWPIDMEWRLGLVATLGVICAAPWVAITWVCHQATRPYWLRHHGADPNAHIDTPEGDKRVTSLLQIWDQIVSIGLAFAGLVAVTLVPTGALRNLWLSKAVIGPEATKRLEDAFPSTDVLLYGAMWAFVAAAVVIPLVFSWRTAAQGTVDRCYPPNATTAADPKQIAARAAMEGMLNLNTGLLRNPLTVLTIATPLLAAALAAFVPEIGK